MDRYTQYIIEEREKAALPEVFINYRHMDVYAALSLREQLVKKLGSESVFFASQSIPPGTNYAEIIPAGVAVAKAMLVVIGREWANSLHHSHEWAKREIALGQTRNDLTFLPVLLDDTAMPDKHTLPPDIHPNLLENDSLPFRSDFTLEDGVVILKWLSQQGISH